MFRREHAVQFNRFDVLTAFRAVVDHHHSIASACRRPRSSRIHQMNTQLARVFQPDDDRSVGHGMQLDPDCVDGSGFYTGSLTDCSQTV